MTIRIVQSNHLNILLTGGRAPVTLELARLFAAAGHHVYIAESLKRYLCRVSNAITACFEVPEPRFYPDKFIDALSEIVSKNQIDLIIPTCEEIFYVSRGLDRLKVLCTVFTAPLTKLASLHSKLDFISKASSYGFTVPETKLLQSAMDWEAALDARVPEKGLVLKPVYSRFAAKTILIEPTQQQNSIRNFKYPVPEISPAAPWVAQTFITGRLISTYSIVQQGQLTAYSAYQTTYKAGHGACIHFKSLPDEKVFNWVKRFVELDQFTGQIAFDFIETAEGILYPLECNPRATSGIHLFLPVDRLDLAFLPQAESKLLFPEKTTQSMLSLAMLTFGFSGVRSWKQARNWLSAYGQATDIIFDWRDPLPTIEQFRMLLATWHKSRKLKIAMVEALTYDLEWNGEV